LVRVVRLAVFAPRPPPLTHTVSALVAQHAVAGPQILDFPAYFQDFAAELVTQDLRFFSQRDGSAPGVKGPIAVTLINVQVRATDPDGPDADQDLVWRNFRVGNVLHN
jgi:hypothetical protein